MTLCETGVAGGQGKGPKIKLGQAHSHVWNLPSPESSEKSLKGFQEWHLCMENVSEKMEVVEGTGGGGEM